MEILSITPGMTDKREVVMLIEEIRRLRDENERLQRMLPDVEMCRTLREENERLRKVLEEISRWPVEDFEDWGAHAGGLMDLAEKALQYSKGKQIHCLCACGRSEYFSNDLERIEAGWNFIENSGGHLVYQCKACGS